VSLLFFWVVPTCGSLIPVSRLFNEFNQSLTRGRVGDAVGWFCPDSRFGRIVPLELVTIIAGGDAHCVVKPFPRQGVFGDKVCCGCQAPPGRPHRVRQRGLQVVVTRAWCGPRGLHSGWKARMTGWGSRRGPEKLRLVPLMKFSCCCLPSMRLPSWGARESNGACCYLPADTKGVRSWWVSDVRLSGS
jgi:hypothetical protein